MTRADRIAGCLYGAAIGDALGSAFEFVDSGTIERSLGEPIVRDYLPAISHSLLSKIARKPSATAAMSAFQMAEVAIPRQLFQDILRLIAELRVRPAPVPT
jgi:hypothetical protein